MRGHNVGRYTIDPIPEDVRSMFGAGWSANDRREQGQAAFIGSRAECEKYVRARETECGARSLDIGAECTLPVHETGEHKDEWGATWSE